MPTRRILFGLSAVLFRLCSPPCTDLVNWRHKSTAHSSESVVSSHGPRREFRACFQLASDPEVVLLAEQTSTNYL